VDQIAAGIPERLSGLLRDDGGWRDSRGVLDGRGPRRPA
jgi:hypothetical protein